MLSLKTILKEGSKEKILFVCFQHTLGWTATVDMGGASAEEWGVNTFNVLCQNGVGGRKAHVIGVVVNKPDCGFLSKWFFRRWVENSCC